MNGINSAKRCTGTLPRQSNPVSGDVSVQLKLQAQFIAYLCQQSAGKWCTKGHLPERCDATHPRLIDLSTNSNVRVQRIASAFQLCSRHGYKLDSYVRTVMRAGYPLYDVYGYDRPSQRTMTLPNSAFFSPHGAHTTAFCRITPGRISQRPPSRGLFSLFNQICPRRHCFRQNTTTRASLCPLA